MSTEADVQDADDAFLRAFEAQQLPATAWDHHAHVRVAYLYLRVMPLADALAKLRHGILALNRSHGLVEGPDRGYHETITAAWARLIASTIASYGPQDTFAAFAAEHPHLLCRTTLRLFYSRAHISSPTARHTIVAPDLAALPEAR